MAADRLKATELRLIEDLFEMGGGHVLDFSNRTFSEFFADELNINIDDNRWRVDGDSKAKRLRYYLRSNTAPIVVRTLVALWNYREANRKRSGKEDTVANAEELFYDIIERLGGKRPVPKPEKARDVSGPAIDSGVYSILRSDLLDLNGMEPYPRAYAFERFFNKLFDANGLAPRASFRLVGEQIDGSFELASDTYLLEAKWTAEKIGVSDLRSFNAKVEHKASWSRGLFVSDSGFTEDGLIAFGTAKSIICMDGLELYEMLDGCVPLADVIGLKARHAAETGNPFVRFQDLVSKYR